MRRDASFAGGCVTSTRSAGGSLRTVFTETASASMSLSLPHTSVPRESAPFSHLNDRPLSPPTGSGAYQSFRIERFQRHSLRIALRRSAAKRREQEPELAMQRRGLRRTGHGGRGRGNEENSLRQAALTRSFRHQLPTGGRHAAAAEAVVLHTIDLNPVLPDQHVAEPPVGRRAQTLPLALDERDQSEGGDVAGGGHGDPGDLPAVLDANLRRHRGQPLRRIWRGYMSSAGSPERGSSITSPVPSSQLSDLSPGALRLFTQATLSVPLASAFLYPGG